MSARSTAYLPTAESLDQLYEELGRRATKLQEQVYAMEVVAELGDMPLNKEQRNRLQDRVYGYHEQMRQVREAAGVCRSFDTAAEGLA